MGALGERNGREGALAITGILLTLQSCIIHHCKVALVNILNLFTTLFSPLHGSVCVSEYMCMCRRKRVVVQFHVNWRFGNLIIFFFLYALH